MLEHIIHAPDPDAPLVNAAREGDVRAFDALVYRYQGAMRRYIHARLDGAYETERLVEEVFVTAWRDLPSFRRDVRFRTWLFGIATLYCQDAGRRFDRLRRLLGPAFATPPPATVAPEIGPVFWPIAVADREAISDCVAALPEPERHILELYYLAELTLPEIARLLGRDQAVVSQRFAGAHAQLRERLRGPAPEKREMEMAT